MGIPEDYYRATGETMGQACRRLAPTLSAKIIAERIGFASASGLRAALKARGIEIDWPHSNMARGSGARDRITDEELDQFVSLRRGGMGRDAAASVVGRDRRSIERVLAKRRPGTSLKRGQHPRSTYTDDVLAKYAELRATGETWDAAAEQLGVDPCNVYRAIRQYSPESRAA